MRPQVREPFRIRQLIASIFALGFLAGAVVALIAYVIRDGFDVGAGFGVVVAVAMAWLFVRAMAGSPPRAGTMRTLVGSVLAVLAIVGPVLLVILGYAPIFGSASDVSEDRALLVVSAVLLLLTFVSATLGGRRLIKTNENGAAERS
jgi:drug/metabolite transporter (DMT)-like permease